ncbi:unnamed protein product, partial [Meganyctiphanes norvegica]
LPMATVVERGTLKQRLPTAIIIGVGKCGTDALRDMLSMHPNIVAATSEIHYFNNNNHYRLGLEWYRKLMPLSYEDQITIEKTPHYFTSTEAPKRMFKYNSTIRLLLVVKDPVTRALSHYAHIKYEWKMKI